MTLPPMDPDGRLPAGRHPASLSDLEDRFVHRAPHAAHRALIWRGFLLHVDLIRAAFGPTIAWVDGGFITHKLDAPRDVDVVYLVPGVEMHRAFTADPRQVLELITLQDLIVGQPGPAALDRLQPVGGTVDAFLVPAEDSAKLDYWDRLWSAVKGADGRTLEGATKGYVEVRLP